MNNPFDRIEELKKPYVISDEDREHLHYCMDDRCTLCDTIKEKRSVREKELATLIECRDFVEKAIKNWGEKWYREELSLYMIEELLKELGISSEEKT